MKVLKLSVLALIAGFVTVSCGNEEAAATDSTTTTTATETTTPVVEEVSTEALVAKTTIDFDKMEHDFGEITDEAPVETIFKITNTGNEPLIITNAKGSCGCTVPNYPTEPVPPGETRDITVSFNPSGKGSPEGNAQTKQVTIDANTEAPTVLTIKALVKGEAPQVNAAPAH